MSLLCGIMLIFAGATRSVAAGSDDDAAKDAYWQTHSLVFASVVGSTQTGGERPKSEISLRPKLRLSGALDPGKIRELPAEVDPKRYGKAFKLPPAGAFVLVVLVKSGERYVVWPDRASFM